MHYLVTGHTGFKGAWLCLELLRRGNKVSGVGLDPYIAKNGDEGIFSQAKVSEKMKNSGGKDVRLDIRDYQKLNEVFTELKPDVVIHLAAQPLVRLSYSDPRFTYETNIIGTFNVMEASKSAGSVKAQLIITTDKTYANINKVEGYKEDEPLGVGGHCDPYSSSKAAADIVAQTQIHHPNYNVPTTIARGGNVIGGGDVSEDRLVVDLIRDCKDSVSTFLRNPNATRPWQYVLDCNNGYLMLVDEILAGNQAVIGEAFNVGSSDSGLVNVGDIATDIIEIWNSENSSTSEKTPAKMWQTDKNVNHPPEANLLRLDTEKIEKTIDYESKLNIEQMLKYTVEYEFRTNSGEDAYAVAMQQLERFYNN